MGDGEVLRHTIIEHVIRYPKKRVTKRVVNKEKTILVGVNDSSSSHGSVAIPPLRYEAPVRFEDSTEDDLLCSIYSGYSPKHEAELAAVKKQRDIGNKGHDSQELHNPPGSVDTPRLGMYKSINFKTNALSSLANVPSMAPSREKPILGTKVVPISSSSTKVTQIAAGAKKVVQIASYTPTKVVPSTTGTAVKKAIMTGTSPHPPISTPRTITTPITTPNKTHGGSESGVYGGNTGGVIRPLHVPIRKDVEKGSYSFEIKGGQSNDNISPRPAINSPLKSGELGSTTHRRSIGRRSVDKGNSDRGSLEEKARRDSIKAQRKKMNTPPIIKRDWILPDSSSVGQLRLINGEKMTIPL